MTIKKSLITISSLLCIGITIPAILPTNLQSISIVQASEINHQTEIMSADGYGAMPSGMPAGRAKMMARRAAIVDAQRNLVEMIKGTSVDAETTVENFLLQSDTIKTKVNGVVTGAKVVSESIDSDGSYKVTMEVPMYGIGSVADIAINAVVGNNAPVPVPAPDPNFTKTYQPEPQANIGNGYSGLAIDAKGSELVRTFCPAIYDTNGRAIYGVYNVDKTYAIDYGVVGYAHGQENWNNVTAGNSRAGSNPLVVKIVEVRQRVANKCDVVISVEDANRILAENQRSHFLDRYAVVFEY